MKGLPDPLTFPVSHLIFVDFLDQKIDKVVIGYVVLQIGMAMVTVCSILNRVDIEFNLKIHRSWFVWSQHSS